MLNSSKLCYPRSTSADGKRLLATRALRGLADGAVSVLLPSYLTAIGFSSLRVGLQEVLSRGRDAAMVTLVDRPPVKMETLQTLESAFEQAITKTRRKWAVIPEFQGKHGHPILVGREMMEAFLRAPETSDAREVEHSHLSQIEYVPVDDPLVAVNVDTPEQYASLNLPPQLLPSS